MWPFKKKKDKVYKYGSAEFTEETLKIHGKIRDWLDKNPEYIPVSIAFCPGYITRTVLGCIIYKYEVK